MHVIILTQSQLVCNLAIQSIFNKTRVFSEDSSVKQITLNQDMEKRKQFAYNLHKMCIQFAYILDR